MPRCREHLLGALLLVCSLPLLAQKPGRALTAIGISQQSQVTVRIVSVDAGLSIIAGQVVSIDLGPVFWGGKGDIGGIQHDSTVGFSVASMRVGLQLQCPTFLVRPVVELQASLRESQNGIQVVFDGRLLSGAPSVVSNSEPCASTNAHNLSLSIAKSVPPGPFRYNVDFTATAK
jgi:hypothetical protein